MTREKLEEIFEETKSNWDGDNALQGLNILNKHSKGKSVLCAAKHDIIYSLDVEDTLENGLTEEDALSLAKLNWMLDEHDCFACFV